MRLLWTCLASVALTGCMVGPDYKRPDAPAAPAFKELADWTPSHPADAVDKGAWWSVYNDPELDRLERMVAVSNQTVAEFEANYRNAVALVAEARASLFPTVGLSGRQQGRFRQHRDAIHHQRHDQLGSGCLGPDPPPG